MKNAKKLILLALCAVLLVGASVMGTLAYLTSQTETITNTMTVGQVKITMDEAPVDVYGVVQAGNRVTTGNTYKLIPGHEYVKDPVIHVGSESEDCWLFVKIENGIVDIEKAGKTIAEQLATNGWTQIDTANNVWAYGTKAEADDEVKTFEYFTIDGEKDIASYADKTIAITAYAVQADGFDTAAEAWTAANFS